MVLRLIRWPSLLGGQTGRQVCLSCSNLVGAVLQYEVQPLPEWIRLHVVVECFWYYNNYSTVLTSCGEQSLNFVHSPARMSVVAAHLQLSLKAYSGWEVQEPLFS